MSIFFCNFARQKSKMTSLEIIKQPIAEEFAHFQKMFADFAVTDNPLLADVLHHVVQRKGKQMRPMMTLLFAKLYGEIADSTYNAALALELLHTASLIHDDVVDESLERRGQASVNALFGNQVSVLVGDYLLATGLQYMIRTDDLRMAHAVAPLAKVLADGELFQLFQSHENVISEDVYYHIIKMKTATLFSASAQVGALSVHASDDEVERAALFGEYAGICFQIRDDIFDYYDSPEIGKPTGNDMREGKLTLPIIYAVRNHGNDHILSLIKQLKAGELSDEGIDELITFAKDNGGIEYAEQKMEEYRQKAFNLLPEDGPKDIINSIQAHVDYVIGRSR